MRVSSHFEGAVLVRAAAEPLSRPTKRLLPCPILVVNVSGASLNGHAAQPLTAAAAVALVEGLSTYVVRVRFGNDMEWAGAGVLAAKVVYLSVVSCGLASREHQALPLDFAEDATGKEHRPLSDDSVDVLDFIASVIWTRKWDWNIVAGGRQDEALWDESQRGLPGLSVVIAVSVISPTKVGVAPR
jgi:hypothetical protein